MKPGMPSAIPNASATFFESSNPELVEGDVELERAASGVIG